MFTQSKNYCFTDYELLDWDIIYKESDEIRYICWGLEVCPSTKRKHYQGWIQIKNKKRIGGIKKLCRSKKIHIESCMGTEGENNKYCQKDNLYQTVGEFITQGKRTDLDELKRILDRGGTLRDIANENMQAFVQYNRGFEKYKNMIDKVTRKSFRKLEVILIHGETGSGKTKKAMEYNDDTYKIQGSALKWWDGYDGEKTLVIDEYDNQINCTELLSILDGYQLRLAIKGGFTYANWNQVIITTNYKELHSRARGMHLLALERRITKKIKMCRGA